MHDSQYRVNSNIFKHKEHEVKKIRVVNRIKTAKWKNENNDKQINMKTSVIDVTDSSIKNSFNVKHVCDYVCNAAKGVPNDTIALVCFLVEQYKRLTHEDTE